MRKTVIIATVISLGGITIAASTGAEARFGAGAIANAVADVSSAQPAHYPAHYYGYRYHRRPYYARHYYAPRYYAPRYSFSYKNSRDALATCHYC